MKLFELLHLAERAPAQVTAPRLPQTGMGDRVEAARREEARGRLMGQALVLDETMVAGRSNSLLVQTHCIGVSPFEACDFGRHQGVFVAERRWIVVGPLPQLLAVLRQEVAPSALLAGARALIERRHGKRSIIIIVEEQDLSGYDR